MSAMSKYAQGVPCGDIPATLRYGIIRGFSDKRAYLKPPTVVSYEAGIVGAYR